MIIPWQKSYKFRTEFFVIWPEIICLFKLLQFWVHWKSQSMLHSAQCLSSKWSSTKFYFENICCLMTVVALIHCFMIFTSCLYRWSWSWPSCMTSTLAVSLRVHSGGEYTFNYIHCFYLVNVHKWSKCSLVVPWSPVSSHSPRSCSIEE